MTVYLISILQQEKTIAKQAAQVGYSLDEQLSVPVELLSQSHRPLLYFHNKPVGGFMDFFNSQLSSRARSAEQKTLLRFRNKHDWPGIFAQDTVRGQKGDTLCLCLGQEHPVKGILVQ